MSLLTLHLREEMEIDCVRQRLKALFLFSEKVLVFPTISVLFKF